MSCIEYTVKVDANGDKFWYLNGKLHRVDGPAFESADGDKYWYLNGLFHREDGPAIEWANGSKSWHLNGKCHRVDGPAIEYADGDKYWYLNDIEYTEEEFKKELDKRSNICNCDDCDGKVITVEGQTYKLVKQ